MRAIRLLELHHQKAGLGGKERAVLLALGEHEPRPLRPVGDLPIEVLGLEGGVADPPGPDHRSLLSRIPASKLISRAQRRAPLALAKPALAKPALAKPALAKPAGFGETSRSLQVP